MTTLRDILAISSAEANALQEPQNEDDHDHEENTKKNIQGRSYNTLKSGLILLVVYYFILILSFGINILSLKKKSVYLINIFYKFTIANLGVLVLAFILIAAAFGKINSLQISYLITLLVLLIL
jgi:hypothetical protein